MIHNVESFGMNFLIVHLSEPSSVSYSFTLVVEVAPATLDEYPFTGLTELWLIRRTFNYNKLAFGGLHV